MPNSIFKKQLSPIKPGDPIDYKDVELLKKFITERGKILPRRMTGLTSKQQRDLTLAVKEQELLHYCHLLILRVSYKLIRTITL